MAHTNISLYDKWTYHQVQLEKAIMELKLRFWENAFDELDREVRALAESVEKNGYADLFIQRDRKTIKLIAAPKEEVSHAN